MENVKYFPGYLELNNYILKNKEPQLAEFIESKMEDVVIWTLTSNARSANSIFSIWKDRYTGLYKSIKKDRCANIRYDKQLWSGIEKEMEVLSATKNSYRLQAYQILNKMSDASGHNVLRSVDENQHGDNNLIGVSSESHVNASNTRTSLRTITNNYENNNNNNNDDGRNSDDSTTNAKTFHIKVPSTKDRYMIGEVDMSLSFFAFQLVCQNNFKELHLESNVHHILALSSILLLQKKKFHPDLKAIVDEDTLNTFYDNLQQEYETGRYCKSKFDPVLEQQIRQIIKNVKHKEMNRLDAMIELLSLSKGKTKTIQRIIKSVVNLIEKLTDERLSSEIKEFELCHRYLDPVLLALFDDPENGVLFRWTSTTNQEAKDVSAKGSISTQRPDSCISKLDGLYFDNSLGFVEVKPSSEKNNKYSISKDLVRLGVMTKNSLDISALKGCMGIQVVDHNIEFLMNKLQADGTYTFTEIASITAPSCIDDLGAYPQYFDDLIAILECYEKWCIPLPRDEVRKMYSKRRRSLPDEEFESLPSTRSNKRRSVTMPSL